MKLHLGCGRRYSPGFVHIDVVDYPGRQDYLYNIHYNLFDFDSLKTELERVGFREVHRYDWRETEHAHIDDYSQAYIPHMDKERGVLVSLNVECLRPAVRA